ncbi:MAG: ATP-dependent 6-phosphofructokinase [Candidatus Omnitrophica bacterium]|nr:ATP-dependent 6-phosphofructokinase [Candidatus Omnitrophota bacterium]MBD3269358.1 ATP-dependent 6-phosphofructokinase [Candidatus Omnitrophota bacterium]
MINKAGIKKIGILTRDCAGINATIRAVVRSASKCNVKTVGIYKGYEGLIDAEFVDLNRRSVSGIINLGGSMLKTARSKRFRKAKERKKAVKNLKKENIDGLIVVGGNGSLTGAHILFKDYSFPVIGVPATIDNDVNGVGMSVGADTAINVALDALDKIRDTATSLERIFIVEVMGRECGYIALRVALAGGCEEVLLPERSANLKKICKDISAAHKKGKMTWIIVVAEGKAKAVDVGKMITDTIGLETREVVLGHIQRGGSPTAFDRILAARYGNHAVKMLLRGEKGKCVTLKNEKLATIPLRQAIKTKDIEAGDYYQLIKILT